MRSTTRALGASCLLLAAWGCEGDRALRADQAEQRRPDTGPAIEVLQALEPEVQQIVIGLEGCDFLEIDNIGGGTSDRDANLCSGVSEVSPTCPDGPVVESPPFPANHCDWADIDRATHFNADWQDVVSSTLDDSFQGSCLVQGHKATPKADIGNVGLAASTDGSELYIGWERFAVNGNERGSLILTREPVDLGAVGSCSDPQPLTDLIDGEAYRIDLKVDSTAALPFAQVQVFRYGVDPLVDESVLDQTMAQVLASTHWQPITDSVVRKALNVRSTDKNAVPGEDDEFGIDGNVLATAQWIEVAVDTEAVFGEGCGLDFIGQFTTTASEGVADALKDYNGPFHFTTANLVAELELFESCTAGEFGYALTVTRDGEPVDLETSGLEVTFDVDCDDDTLDATDIVPSSDGTVDLGEPTASSLCTVTANISGGSNGLSGCEATAEADVTVYPPLTATATLAQDCDGTFSYEGEVTSSSGADATFAWTFTFDSETVDRSDASGTVSLPSGSASPTTVTGQLVVTDGTARDTGGEELEECTVTVGDLTVDVFSPITLQLTAASDADCDAEDAETALDTVFVDASFSGGSGQYVLTYTPSAGLSTTCPTMATNNATGSDDCTFMLGVGFCRDGDLTLKVEDSQDNGCEPREATVSAVRECTLDVTPLAGDGAESVSESTTPTQGA